MLGGPPNCPDDATLVLHDQRLIPPVVAVERQSQQPGREQGTHLRISKRAEPMFGRGVRRCLDPIHVPHFCTPGREARLIRNTLTSSFPARQSAETFLFQLSQERYGSRRAPPMTPH